MSQTYDSDPLRPLESERFERDIARPVGGEWRWLLGVFAAALAIRLAYALWLHPPDQFIFSDMGGYWKTSSRWLQDPLQPRRNAMFFPPGTSWLLAGLRLISFDNAMVLNSLWALIAAPVAPILHATTLRLSGSRWAGRTVGCFVVIYYPFISFTGYFLSETPFTTMLALTLLFSLRLADTGRRRDALALGLCIGIGTWFSPQILLSVPLLFLYWLTRMKAFPKVIFRRLLPLALTLGACLGVSAAFAHHHTGQWSIVSQNGGTNRLFGRCHNSVLKGRGTWFGLPPYGALEKLERKRPHFPITVNPVRGKVIKVPHGLLDEEKLHAVADACVRESTLGHQLRNAGTDVVLLWAFNVTWPDVTRMPQRALMRWFNGLNIYGMLPVVASCMFGFGLMRGREREGLLTVYMWTVVATAAAYIGGTRVRTPFDTVMIVLSVTMYWHLGRFFMRLRGRNGALMGASLPPEDVKDSPAPSV